MQENEYFKIGIDNKPKLYFDVVEYNYRILALNEIIEYYRMRIDHESYYIKDNWLLFTINNVRYRLRISNHIDEEKYINEIINYFIDVGCKRVMYLPGKFE